MTTLRIADEILRVYPDVLLGIVRVRNIDNTVEHGEIISQLRKEEDNIRQRFAGVSLNDHPQIAPWREAYRKFGAKPKDYSSSVENLVRRVAKGYVIPHINTLVDIYNLISLRYILPVGGEDLDRIQGDVLLTFAGEAEPAVRLLGEKDERPPHPGEVIYKDEISAICRRWNWKESERTKLTEKTRNAFLVTEALPPVDRSLTSTAIEQLAEAIRKHCGGEVTTDLLDAQHTSTVLFSHEP
jgi:Uncharacterized conserved protein